MRACGVKVLEMVIIEFNKRSEHQLNQIPTGPKRLGLPKRLGPSRNSVTLHEGNLVPKRLGSYLGVAPQGRIPRGPKPLGHQVTLV